jgi:NADH:ubiquinone oxidoreductase subunit C
MKYTNYQELDLHLKARTLQQLEAKLPGLIHSTAPRIDGLIIRTAPSKLRPLALYLRNSSCAQFRTLVDIAVLDKLLPKGRFVLNYLFLSMVTNQRLVVQVYANETTPLPSLSSPLFGDQRFFPGASWLEREVWDMFGIYFSEHGDLRRILTDYGFTAHPLRKDFPLTGFHEVVYNDAEGRVTSEPVELAQEFRVFQL